MLYNHFYFNQLDYHHIPYVTGISHPDFATFAPYANIGCAGCGICSACMLVESLTGMRPSLEDYRDLSYLCEANRDPGTDMSIYGAALARDFHLRFLETNHTEALISCLLSGGAAIINVGGDHDDHVGIFSDVGHFIFAKSFLWQTGEIEILDPAYRRGKFDLDGRRGMVRPNGASLFTRPEVIEEDTKNRSPKYFLFWKDKKEGRHV